MGVKDVNGGFETQDLVGRGLEMIQRGERTIRG